MNHLSTEVLPTETNQTLNTMNTISGKIVLGQTELGIPNLLVVLYDVDPGTRPEEILAGFARDSGSIHNPLNLLSGLGDRLFSTLTGPDGSFRVNFADGEFRIRNEGEKRPDLLLLVFAPEAPGRTLNDMIVFVSPEVRQNAGRLESYFIQLTEEQLKKAGLPIPQDRTPPDDDAGDGDLRVLERKLQTGKLFFDRKATLLHTHVEQEHQTHAERRTATFSVNVKEELSLVPKTLRDSRFFVADGQSIKTKVFDKRATIRKRPPASAARASKTPMNAPTANAANCWAAWNAKRAC